MVRRPEKKYIRDAKNAGQAVLNLVTYGVPARVGSVAEGKNLQAATGLTRQFPA
jgi:hypothetical protein